MNTDEPSAKIENIKDSSNVYRGQKFEVKSQFVDDVFHWNILTMYQQNLYKLLSKMSNNKIDLPSSVPTNSRKGRTFLVTTCSKQQWRRALFVG